ncbi:MAG: SDR family oxidoreductase [Acidobacteriota bacterium]
MGHSILITGAGTGLGLETALYLAGKGYRVFAAVAFEGQRKHVEREAVRRRLSLSLPLLDVTDPKSIRSTVDAIASECGGVNGLINNAGVSLRGYFEDCREEEIRTVFDVNLHGSMAVTREVLPLMRRAGGGRLIFISSIGGRIAAMARSAYCSSKFAIEGFAESLAQEVMPLGLHVSIIEPAIIKTERWTIHRGVADQALDPESPYCDWFRREEELADRLVETSPTTPADVARTVYRALTARRPRLRYVVGSRARLAVLLRRYLPGELFEQIFFRQAVRRVAGPSTNKK